MSPRKPKVTAPSTHSPVKAAKVTKARSKKTTLTALTTSTPSTATGSKYRVKRYKNGLLNLEKTPPHLVDIVQRNATESPFLRLPAEIRNPIYTLAMGGRLVKLRSPSSGGDPASAQDDHGSIVPVAFRLPEVCRQIYSEAALTAYYENVFMLITNSSVEALTLAQRKAITNVRIGHKLLSTYLTRRLRIKPLRRSLPDLQHIIVSESILENVVMIRYDISDVWPETDDKVAHFKDWMLQRIKSKDGDMIKVTFDPSGALF